MKLLLYSCAAISLLYAATRSVWHADGELGIELAVLIAAVCVGSGAIVGAVEANRAKPVSQDNGGKRKE